MKNKNNKIKISLVIALAVLLVIVLSCAIYVSDYYRADGGAIAEFAEGYEVTGRHVSSGVIAYEPSEPTAGFIFYPGGKVEYTAYEPLMLALAEKGVLCVLVKMPLNLAVLDVNAADEVQTLLPEDSARQTLAPSRTGPSVRSRLSAASASIFLPKATLSPWPFFSVSSWAIFSR